MRFFVFGLIVSLTSPAFAYEVTGKNLLSGENQKIASGPKGLVVLFLSAKCPCSNSHIAMLKSLKEKFPDFQFVGVHANRDESATEAATYFREKDLHFPVIVDTDLVLADRFKASRTPHAFVIGPDGKTLYRGGVTDSTEAVNAEHPRLREALEDVQAARPVRVAEARSLGCAIARSGHAL